MKIRKAKEFLFLCQKAGFKTLAQVEDYTRKKGLTPDELWLILEERCFPKFYKKEVE